MIIRFGNGEGYCSSNKHIPVTHIQQADPENTRERGMREETEAFWK